MGGSDGYSTLGSLESFDGKAWRAELPLSTARQQHAALFFRGRLWVFGGISIAGSSGESLGVYRQEGRGRDKQGSKAYYQALSEVLIAAVLVLSCKAWS